MTTRPSISTSQSMTGNFIADAAIYQYSAVKDSSSGCNYVSPISTTEDTGIKIAGIAQDDADAYGHLLVTLFGPSLVKAGGTITRNDPLVVYKPASSTVPSTVIKAETGTYAAQSMIIGTALEDAVDGEFFLALINPHILLATS